MSRKEHILHLHNLGVEKEIIQDICNIHIDDIEEIINHPITPNINVESALEWIGLQRRANNHAYYIKGTEQFKIIKKELFKIQLTNKDAEFSKEVLSGALRPSTMDSAFDVELFKHWETIKAELSKIPALERRLITKKVILNGFCPNNDCDEHDSISGITIYKWAKYCPDCGQALDWSDSNDK